MFRKFLAWVGCLLLLAGFSAAPRASGAGAIGVPPGSNGPPIFIVHPQSQFLFDGAKVVFKSFAIGAAPLHYQWYHDEVPIPGANSPTFTLDNAQQSDIGDYYAIATNALGSDVSHSAFLFLSTIIIDLPHPGTVVNFTGAMLPPHLTNIIAISAGTHHAVALREDGSVLAWGSALASALGLTNAPAHLTNIMAVGAGDDFSLALGRDGTISGWGPGIGATVPAELFGVSAMSVAPHRAVALKLDGTLVEWGGPATIPPGVSDVAAVAANDTHTIVAKSDGTVEIFGTPAITLLAAPTNAIKVAADDSFYAVCADGSLLDLAGLATPLPSPLTDMAAVSVRNRRGLALGKDGKIIAWGNASVPWLTNTFSRISAGGLYCLALTTDTPKPRLAIGLAPSGYKLASPIAVSGFVLEAADALPGPFAPVDLATETNIPAEANDPSVTLSAVHARRFFRLRRP